MVVDFTDWCNETQHKIQILIQYHSLVDWRSFEDASHPNPYLFSTRIAREEDGLYLAAVKVELAKGSYQHLLLSQLVACDIQKKYVHYDWLIKIVSRIVSCANTASDLLKMLLNGTLNRGRTAN